MSLFQGYAKQFKNKIRIKNCYNEHVVCCFRSVEQMFSFQGYAKQLKNKLPKCFLIVLRNILKMIQNITKKQMQ